MAKNQIYKGYIASRNIGHLQIPQRIQNLVIRTYVEKLGKTFSLSATEYIMDNCFMMLKALEEEAANYEAITFYSLFMLPAKRDERIIVYKNILEKGCALHFAFEELKIETMDDVQVIEDILLANDLKNQPVSDALFL